MPGGSALDAGCHVLGGAMIGTAHFLPRRARIKRDIPHLCHNPHAKESWGNTSLKKNCSVGGVKEMRLAYSGGLCCNDCAGFRHRSWSWLCWGLLCVNFEFAAGRGDSLCEPRVRAKKTYIYIFNEIDLYHIQSYSPCLVFALHSGAIVVPFFLGAGTRNAELKVANVGKTVMEEFILSWVSLVRSILFFVLNGYGSIPIDTFLVGWTSIYQLFWGSLGTRVLTRPASLF